jgi:hypothetical protein
VKVINTTASRIRIGSVAFTVDGVAWNSQTSREEISAAEREAEQRIEGHRYGPPLLIHSEVPARSSVSGWYATAVARDPRGGAPECKLIVKDGIGNSYEALIRAQEPKTYS